MIFLDTCILINYLNGKDIVRKFIEKHNKDLFCINSIVLMELFRGARNKKELQKIKKELSGLRILDINQNILNLATNIIKIPHYLIILKYRIQ
jgi:predicted nucleic acid-binding protein